MNRSESCQRCDYRLSGLPDGRPCPECGFAAAGRPGLRARRIAGWRHNVIQLTLGLVSLWLVYMIVRWWLVWMGALAAPGASFTAYLLFFVAPLIALFAAANLRRLPYRRIGPWDAALTILPTGLQVDRRPPDGRPGRFISWSELRSVAISRVSRKAYAVRLGGFAGIIGPKNITRRYILDASLDEAREFKKAIDQSLEATRNSSRKQWAAKRACSDTAHS